MENTIITLRIVLTEINMIEQALSTDPNYMPKFKNEVVRITKYTNKNYL